MAVRLNRFLSEAGLGSRRSVEQLVRDGRVQLNGQRVETLATTVDEGDEVRVDGRVVRIVAGERLFLYHKPVGVVCSFRRQGSAPCLPDVLPPGLLEGGRLFHVGRLDRDSSGLLLLGSDGELAHALTHPAHPVYKRYEVVASGLLDAEAEEILREGGLRLEDGPCLPARVRRMGEEGGRGVYEVELREGRKRQLRRMFEALGPRVLRLHRTRFGPVELGALGPGQLREATEEERRRLHEAAAGAGD